MTRLVADTAVWQGVECSGTENSVIPGCHAGPRPFNLAGDQLHFATEAGPPRHALTLSACLRLQHGGQLCRPEWGLCCTAAELMMVLDIVLMQLCSLYCAALPC